MHQPAVVRPLKVALPLLFLALFMSGLAAIVNESVWQRALKVYLAGCESTSAMIVVLAFMVGLGAGSLCMGLVAHRVRNPLRALAIVELMLFCVNLSIAAILAMDIAESVYSFQRLAVSLGIPLRLVYGLSAAAVLLLPCFLMGITMPLVSEAAQRQLRCETPGFITILFVLNTLGSVLGGVVAGFYLMPYWGQRISLLAGASCNLLAALVLGCMCLSWRGQAVSMREEGLKFRSGRLLPEEVLGFWFGFLSLGYEMYLFRVAALAHAPLPYNFSLVLCYYLLFWSIGMFLAKKMREGIGGLMVISALVVIAMPLFHWYDRNALHQRLQELLGENGLPLAVSGAIYCLPCVAFGMLFGQVIARSAKRWGNDVGRYYGLNTLGSCLGILVMTLVGYEYNHAYSALLIGAGYLALLAYARARMELPTRSAARVRLPRWGLWAACAIGIISVPLHVLYDRSPQWFVPYIVKQSRQTYYGRGGVIEVMADGEIHWDGLRHATLSYNDSHTVTNDWKQAAVPFICHGGRGIDDALVIGMGSGITAGTLARSDAVRSIDVYEIDRTLEAIFRDYPDETLGVAHDPKIRIIWRDGRAGLALSDKQYDLITQAPLYLKQAGSSILLSRQHMQMVRRRLRRNGVYCIYSNTFGNQQQALLVRKTAASVFKYCESFGGGYMIVASNEPFSFRPREVVAINAAGHDRLIGEIARFGASNLEYYWDTGARRLEWEDCPYLVTDDHPLLEYPGVATELVPWPRSR